MKLWIVVIALAVSACASVPHREQVGRLDVDGPNAFLNGTRASKGTLVHIGDRVSTGAATSVKVLLQAGGYVQLDQNTDPDFLKEGSCLLIQILTGRVFVDGTALCIQTPNIAGRQGSQVHYGVKGGRTETVVLSGSVAMRQPNAVTLTQYDYYAVAGNAAEGRRKLTPQEAQNYAAWRWAWTFAAKPDAMPAPLPPSPPQGFYCCVSRELTPLSESACAARKGRYFQAPAAEAAAYCRAF
jgi:hypothetical protein